MSQINPQEIIDRKILEVCEHTQCQQVGIDISVADDVVLDKNEFLNISCNEIVRVPRNMFALVISRSTFNRRGVIIRGCVFDPSYRGKIHLSVYNLSGDVFRIPKNERIAQIVFFDADPASQYNGQYQDEALDVRP